MRALELGTVGGMRERLTAPVPAGRKTATTGLPAEYVEETGAWSSGSSAWRCPGTAKTASPRPRSPASS
ncbi:hypothetical protein [Streptomyces sp. NPDC014676]|uniref:hypothetical protein n=1 Tax=Streptomyces sp. NPDC014676 TaxID=3364879 RepID=UPI0036F4BE6F